MRLENGHNVLLLGVRVDASSTVEKVEASVVRWLSDLLRSRAEGPSSENEWAIGAADPVTVVPVTSQTIAEREATFCRAPGNSLTALTPPEITGEVMPVIVHLDWAGQPQNFGNSFRDRLLGWEFDAVQPDLVVRAQCFTGERVRNPVPEEPFVPFPRAPNLGGSELTLMPAAIAAGVGLLGLVVGWLLLGRRR